MEYCPKYFFPHFLGKMGAFGKRAAGSKEDSAFLCGGLPEIDEEDFFESGDAILRRRKKGLPSGKGGKSRRLLVHAPCGGVGCRITPHEKTNETVCRM